MDTILVDFNMRNADGTYLTVLSPEQSRSLREGEVVTAFDGEGTECTADVVGIGPDGAATLRPHEGSWNQHSVLRPTQSELLIADG